MGDRKGTTKSGGQKHDLDKFYTKPEVAEWCLSKLDLQDYSIIIEPSAGSGSFSNLIPNCLAMDVQPENSRIKKQDWFTYSQERTPGKTLVVGNPPFGQQNTLAISFINHAAAFADTVAFVLPLSFQKTTVQEKIHPNLHLVESYVLDKKSFEVNGESMNVPCVFQIWEHNETPRAEIPVPELVGFSFVKKNASPDLFIQRIGGNAGKFGLNWQDRSVQSNIFIKVNDGFTIPQIISDFSKLSFPERSYSVGPCSISRKGLLRELLAVGSTLVK